MTHKQLMSTCAQLGIPVSQVPATERRSYSGSKGVLRVYWSTSYEGGLLDGGRLSLNGRDTHFKSVATLKHYAKLC